MEFCDFGSTEEIKNRRIMTITLQERGLKPSEIRKSMENTYPKITMQTIYSDLKWGITNVKREDREKLWDKHFMKELELLLKEAKRDVITVGLLKLLLSHRQDMRKRHGLYTEKVELSGETSINLKMYRPKEEKKD